MAVAIHCTGCGQVFRVKDEYRGKAVRCPGCGGEQVAEGPHLASHDAFISHSSKDKVVADRLVATLEGCGIRCWVAPRDIPPGATWSSAIIDGIADSRVMVLIFTDRANRSPQVMREVERAVAKGLAVLPVRLQDVAPSKDMEYFISSSHWLDATSGPLDEHLRTLCGRIQSLLADEPADPQEDAGAGGTGGGRPAAVPAAARGQRPRWRGVAGLVAVAACALTVAVAVVYGAHVRPGRQPLSAGPPGAANAPAAAANPAVMTPGHSTGAGRPAGSIPAAPVASVAPTRDVAPGPPGQNGVDLIALIDPDEDAVSGSWRVEAGAIVSDDRKWSRLRIPYKPPAEYDLIVEFTRVQEGNEWVMVMLSHDDTTFQWNMRRDGVCGFELVGDRVAGDLGDNPTTASLERPRLGERCRFVLQVRSGFIAACRDEKPVAQYKTDFGDIGQNGQWAIGPGALGVGSMFGRTTFHRLELIPVTGRGQVLPHYKPAAKGPAAGG